MESEFEIATARRRVAAVGNHTAVALIKNILSRWKNLCLGAVSAQRLEKVHFRKADPRRYKPFLGKVWLNNRWILPGLAKFGPSGRYIPYDISLIAA
jgi:hypothetical protein